jgi:DNA-directed RNA polymerase specialized sigma24 family protein
MTTSLEAAEILARQLEQARLKETEIMAARDRAMVSAVRAGARLAEVADAAGLTRAAVSLIVRKHLPPRPARGGPLSREDRYRAHLGSVAEASGELREIRSAIEGLRVRRDDAIIDVVGEGIGVRQTARALGLTAATVSTIAREAPRASQRGHTPL